MNKNDLALFGIVPRDESLVSISRGFAQEKGGAKNVDYFIVHKDKECRDDTVTLPEILKAYECKQPELKKLFVAPAIGRENEPIDAWRMYYKRAGLYCSADDNQHGSVFRAFGKHEIGADLLCDDCELQDIDCKIKAVMMLHILPPKGKEPIFSRAVTANIPLPASRAGVIYADYEKSLQAAQYAYYQQFQTSQGYNPLAVPLIIEVKTESTSFADGAKRIKKNYQSFRIELDIQRYNEYLRTLEHPLKLIESPVSNVSSVPILEPKQDFEQLPDLSQEIPTQPEPDGKKPPSIVPEIISEALHRRLIVQTQDFIESEQEKRPTVEESEKFLCIVAFKWFGKKYDKNNIPLIDFGDLLQADAKKISDGLEKALANNPEIKKAFQDVLSEE
ncbi:MAG: hypothetical protein DRP02_13610 [Candidatus Gerdarchaeota archaeon]|nr:MAG: hypothetical protein DRP02_13610 [Candidatus Gerdarchaeota archaeon]